MMLLDRPFITPTVLFVYILSPETGVSTETNTTLEGTVPLHTPVVEDSVEQIQAKKSADDVEAIKDILSEITEMR